MCCIVKCCNCHILLAVDMAGVEQLYQCSYYYNVTTATHFGSAIKRTPSIISV